MHVLRLQNIAKCNAEYIKVQCKTYETVGLVTQSNRKKIFIFNGLEGKAHQYAKMLSLGLPSKCF